MKLTTKNSPKLLHPYLDSINSLYQVYVRTMKFKKNRDNLHAGWLVLAWIYVSYAYTRDIWFNMTTASQMFKDPFQWKRLTFTARLKGYRAMRLYTKMDFERAAIAEFLCDEWLDQEDPSGDHC